MLLKSAPQTTKLRDALSESGVQLSHTECADIIARLDPYPDWNTRSLKAFDKHPVAEQYLDELLEGLFELNYTKFTQRFEQQYLVMFPETSFLREMRHVKEDIGNYLGREYMGSLNAKNIPGDDRYPNRIRHLWRGFFEKNEAIIRVSTYLKDEVYYVNQAGTL